MGRAEVVELPGDGGNEVVVVEIERNGVRRENRRKRIRGLCGWMSDRVDGGAGAEGVGQG